MASSSRPYQSRLLKQVLRQSRQLGNRYQHSLRQAKIAVTWGAQVVLYPVYALFQTSRVAKRQFAQAQSAPPQLSLLQRLFGRSTTPKTPKEVVVPLPSEPILQVLQLFSPVLEQAGSDRPVSPKTTAKKSALAVAKLTALPQAVQAELPEIGPSALGQLTVQGIASQLSDRRLVLIAPDNRELDLLSAQQQSAMRKYISWAIAHYWYAHRQAQSLEQAAAGILPLPRRRSQALPPVALFRQLMGWMQTGSVAIATNLFKESELVKTLGYRRHTLRQQSVQPRLPAAILPLKPSRPLVTYRQQVTQLLAKLRQSQALQRSPIADLPLLLKPASQSAVALKLTQFFSRQKVAQPRSVSWHEAYEPKLSDKETSDSLAATESAGSFSQIGSPPQSAAKSTQMTATATATVTAAPDWIETTATVIEYIEHPLEKLLRLIDQGLLWLEEKFAQLRDRLWKQS